MYKAAGDMREFTVAPFGKKGVAEAFIDSHQIRIDLMQLREVSSPYVVASYFVEVIGWDSECEDKANYDFTAVSFEAIVVKVRADSGSDPDPNVIALAAKPKENFERCFKGLRTDVTFKSTDADHYD